MAPKPDAAGTENQTKKPYHTPEVILYGDIREITRSVGPKGNPDGGGGAAAGPKSGT